MVREKIQHSDFHKISKSNDYFLWNFIQKNQNKNSVLIYSYFDEKENYTHPLKEFLNIVPLNYYESYVENSIDFLLGLGFRGKDLYSPPREDLVGILPREFYFNPYMLLFKKSQLINSTRNHCYCVEGFTEMILKFIPSILDGINLD